MLLVPAVVLYSCHPLEGKNTAERFLGAAMALVLVEAQAWETSHHGLRTRSSGQQSQEWKAASAHCFETAGEILQNERQEWLYGKPLSRSQGPPHHLNTPLTHKCFSCEAMCSSMSGNCYSISRAHQTAVVFGLQQTQTGRYPALKHR